MSTDNQPAAAEEQPKKTSESEKDQAASTPETKQNDRGGKASDEGKGSSADSRPGRGEGRFNDRGGRRGGQGGRKNAPRRQDAEPSEFVEKVIAIRRITKVTKGGKKLSFSALVVVGDMKGRVGYSHSKAGEVAIAIRKALMQAKRCMVKIPMRGTTIPHEIIGVCGGASVLLKPAAEGTGIIAAGPVRAVCDGAGIHNILTKCHRSNNPINVVKATFDGLMRLKSVASVAVEAQGQV